MRHQILQARVRPSPLHHPFVELPLVVAAIGTVVGPRPQDARRSARRVTVSIEYWRGTDHEWKAELGTRVELHA